MTLIDSTHHEYRIWSEFMASAYREAIRSPDPSTQTAAALAVGRTPYSSGTYRLAHNRIHPSIEPNYTDREEKLARVTHAESAAIYAAANAGLCTRGATMVCPWADCTRCALAIIESGISRLILHKQRMELPSRWSDQITQALGWISRHGIQIDYLHATFPDCQPILIEGKKWQP